MSFSDPRLYSTALLLAVAVFKAWDLWDRWKRIKARRHAGGENG